MCVPARLWCVRLTMPPFACLLKEIKSLETPDDQSIMNLFIGGVEDPFVTQNDLRDYFYQFGELRVINVLKKSKAAIIHFTRYAAWFANAYPAHTKVYRLFLTVSCCSIFCIFFCLGCVWPCYDKNLTHIPPTCLCAVQRTLTPLVVRPQKRRQSRPSTIWSLRGASSRYAYDFLLPSCAKATYSVYQTPARVIDVYAVPHT